MEKIYFYEKFHPEKFIQNGILCNNLFEFYIPININLTINNINCIENVNWDLLNVEMTPEIFAEILVNDENLDNDFIIPIAMQIRKEIHYFIYDLFKNISNNYEKYEQEKYLKETDKKTRKNYEESKKYIATFLFDPKLSSLLGKKRKFNEENEYLPDFLKNKRKADSKNTGCGKETKKKNNKKGSQNKNKVSIVIDHDKQSTTNDENEERE